MTLIQPVVKSGHTIGLHLALWSFCAVAYAQSMSFPGGTSPALQATAAQSVAASGHPGQVLDGAGHAFAITYDGNGRLASVKKTSGRNVADMVVSYDTTNRIQRVRFDNGYEVIFRYASDGTEEIRDSLGGRLVRAGSPLVTQSASDPSGYLVETVKRVERLFGFINPVAGLNVTMTATSLQ